MPNARRALVAAIAIVALAADLAAALFMVAIVRAGEGARIDFQTLGGFILGGTYSIVGRNLVPCSVGVWLRASPRLADR